MAGRAASVAECVEVESRYAERTILALRSAGLLLAGAKAKKSKLPGRVRVALARGALERALALLRGLGIPAEGCVDEFEVGSRGLRYVDLLRGVLPEDVVARLPRSYQIVGDVAVVHLDDDLAPYGSTIGEAIARVAKGVRAVYSSVVTEGEFRVRRLVKLWGEDVGETVHTEYGVRIVVDIRKVYFNPTLSYEHRRVSEEVRDGERVLDLFSGVGPYSLHIASRREATCFAVDSNPWTLVYLAKSMSLNRLRGRVIPVLSRVEDFLGVLREESFDRAIVDLPHRSLEYLGEVARVLSRGGVAHVYALGGESPPAPGPAGGLELVEVRRVLDYAPRKYVYGMKFVKK